MSRAFGPRWRRLVGATILGAAFTIIAAFIVTAFGLVVFVGIRERQWASVAVLLVPLLLVLMLKTGLWLFKVPGAGEVPRRNDGGRRGA